MKMSKILTITWAPSWSPQAFGSHTDFICSGASLHEESVIFILASKLFLIVIDCCSWFVSQRDSQIKQMASIARSALYIGKCRRSLWAADNKIVSLNPTTTKLPWMCPWERHITLNCSAVFCFVGWSMLSIYSLSSLLICQGHEKS